jgi:hypothetical protein
MRLHTESADRDDRIQKSIFFKQKISPSSGFEERSKL